MSDKVVDRFTISCGCGYEVTETETARLATLKTQCEKHAKMNNDSDKTGIPLQQ